MMAINQGRRLGLPDDLHLRLRELNAGLDSIIVIFQPTDPMRSDPPQVSSDQDIRTDLGILLRHPLSAKDILHETHQHIDRNPHQLIAHP